MSFKPLRNSKGVNKQFRSPFSNVKELQNDNGKCNANTPQSNSSQTPLRVSVSKRVLFQQTPPAKRPCLDNDISEECGDAQDKKLFRSDLDALKKRVEEKQQCINSLKTTLQYKRKNRAEDLEAAIEMWTLGCQDALKDYQNVLEEHRGESVNMTQVLSLFGIDHKLIRFSIDNETFY